MNDESDFFNQLEAAIVERKEQVEKTTLIRLKENLGIFQTYFQNIYNILLRKALIQEDPYKNDDKIMEIGTPSSEPLIESGFHENMSRRISHFHSMLEYLNTYYQLHLDTTTIKDLQKINELMNYINWLNISPASTDPPTRFLGEILQKIKMGSDKVSTQIITDSCNQIEKNVKMIYVHLEELVLLLREIYKYEVRKFVLSNIEKDLELLSGNPDGAVKAIKGIFPKYLKNKSFYPDLIKEILEEDFSAKKDALRSAIISRLKIKEKKTQTQKKSNDPKPNLLQGLRYIATAGFYLKDVIVKLNDNQQVYESRKMGFGAKVVKWIKKIFKGKNDSLLYEIEYLDAATSTTKTEKINFSFFVEDLQKKLQLYLSLANRASSTYAKLEGATEEQLYEYLNRNLAAIHLIHQRLIGFNDFFKNEIPKDKKGKVRTLNLELNALKNNIVKANKKKHEYVSSKEEIEQLKRLGIKVDGQI